jgi:hypothetical protein
MYHVYHQGQQFGPYSIKEINDYLAQGALDGSTLVLDPSINSWVEISTIYGIEIPTNTDPIQQAEIENQPITEEAQITYHENWPVIPFSTNSRYYESVDDLIDKVTEGQEVRGIVTSAKSGTELTFGVFGEEIKSKDVIEIKSSELELYWKGQAGLKEDTNIGSLPSWVGSWEQLYGCLVQIVMFAALFLFFFLFADEIEKIVPLDSSIIQYFGAFLAACYLAVRSELSGEKDLNLDVGIITRTHFVVLARISQTMYILTPNSKSKKSIVCSKGVAFHLKHSVFDAGWLGREIHVKNCNDLVKSHLKYVHPKHAKRLIKRNLDKVIDHGSAKTILGAK